MMSTSIVAPTFHYNSRIRFHADAGRDDQALLLFHRMIAVDRVSPDRFTFPTVLKACARLPTDSEGKQIHSLVLKSRFAPADDTFILSSLVHFYARRGLLRDARLVFDRIEHKSVVSWNTMLDGYARFGYLEHALQLFDEMPDRSIYSWNALIGGCARDGRGWEALKIFIELRTSGLKPDVSTMVSFVSAVADLGLLALGRLAHAYVIRSVFSLDGALGVALIDMYSRCGSIAAAYNVFLAIDSKNIKHWTAMVSGLAAHGLTDAALRVFHEMIKSRCKPNFITFVAVLSACSHRGLLCKGFKYFDLMVSLGIEPRVEHYGCLIDMLGRAGFVAEALELVSRMPVDPGPVVWSSLLSACRNQGEASLAEAVAKKMIESDPNNGSTYVLLSHVYGKLGRWEDFRIAKKVMIERKLTKVAGTSWIEIDGYIHEFVSCDRIHLKTKEIYAVLDALSSF